MSLVSDAIEPGLHTEAAATVAISAKGEKLPELVKQEARKQTSDTLLDLSMSMA